VTLPGSFRNGESCEQDGKGGEIQEGEEGRKGGVRHTPWQTALFILIYLIFRSKLILAFNN
jgi:hypothetical protein